MVGSWKPFYQDATILIAIACMSKSNKLQIDLIL
jgi:hypothetical protein